jgi:hypothetical protein
MSALNLGERIYCKQVSRPVGLKWMAQFVCIVNMFNLDKIGGNVDKVRKCALMLMWGYVTGFASVLTFRQGWGYLPFD